MSEVKHVADSVVEAGHRLAAIIGAKDINEDLHSDAGAQERGRLETEARVLLDAQAAAEAEICQSRATSLEGAMAQIVMAHEAAAAIADLAERHHEDYAAKSMRRISRCLYSVLDVVAKAAGVDPVAIAGNYYMPDSHNPFDVVDVALGRLARKS